MHRAHRPDASTRRPAAARQAAPRHSSPLTLAVAAATPVLCALAARPAHATPQVYVGPTGSWSLGANWASGAAPAAGDDAQLGQADNNITVTFDATAGNLTNLASITIDNVGTSLATVTLTQPANTLSTLTETVGLNGAAVLNITGGVHQVTGAGSNSLFVAVNPGSVGTVNLGNANLTVTDSVYVGVGGNGAFNQTAGNHYLNGNLTLGGEATGTAIAGTGAYTMTGGSIVAANLYVGLSGSGVFTHMSGAASFGTITLGYLPAAIGVYTQAGGSIFTNNQVTIGAQGLGTWNQAGGQHTAGGIVIGESANSFGSLDVTGGEFDCATSLVIGAAGAAQVFHSGGTLTAARLVTSLTAGVPEATYDLSGNGVLHVIRDPQGFNGLEFLGYNGDFTFTQDGGTHIVDGYLATAVQAGARVTYTLNAGTLSAPAQSIGYGSAADNTFNQNGGVNNASTFLTVGDQPGANATYNFAAGTMNVQTLYAPAHGRGVFNQSGGVANLADLVVALTNTGNGTVNLSGGVLNVSESETIGTAGKGAFLQTGGTHHLAPTATVTIGGTGGTGAYTLSAGAITGAGAALVNNGSFTQTGGVATVGPVTGTGTLKVGGGAGAAPLNVARFSQPTVNLLNRATLTVATNAATFTNAATNLTIALGAVLDLGNHNLLTAAPAATVRQYLVNGYNNGAWNGTATGGSVGVIRSAAANAAPLLAARSLGYATKADASAGLVSTNSASLIGANQTLVKYTTPADFNLSGGTDFNDFLSLQNNYNKPGGWAAGDADYNGVVNFNDFLILQNNFNHNLPPAAAPVAGQLASAAPLSKSSVNAGPGGVVRPAALASSTVSVAAALTGVPVVKYVLSKNDDGTGKFAAGKFAVYAVDSTADGNQGMVSYGFDVQGFNSVANGLVNFSPRGSYDDGTGNGTANDVGFTILRSVNAPGTVQNVPNPVRGSQDTVAAGANPAIMVFGLGQHSGNLATAAPTSMTAGTVIQPVYNGPSQFSIGATSFQSGLLMVKGTFAGDGSALLWNADLTNDKSNVFISSAVNPVTGTYDTTAAAIQLVTQDLNSTPEPTVLSLFALAGMGLLARRRHRTT